MLMKIREVEFVRFPELARWIHCDLSAETFLPLMPTTLKRMRLHPRPLPIEAVAVEERVAAAYFTQLEGRVATLGGVRALSGFQDIGARLIEQLARDLRAEHGLQQIQAVVPAADLESREILGASGFTPLTTVLHLWRDARLGAIPPPKVVPRHGWTLANTLSAN